MMTDEQKAHILQLHAMGVGYTSIGKEMGIKRDTIKSFISRNKTPCPRQDVIFAEEESFRFPSRSRSGFAVTNAV